DQLCGNATQIRRISDWLLKRGKNGPGPFALFISGPPGIGKSTAANVVLKSQGFIPYEINASILRTKDSLFERVSQICTRKSIFGKNAIILDEIDGAITDTGGQDRYDFRNSGVQGVIDFLVQCEGARKNHQKDIIAPIICIAN